MKKFILLLISVLLIFSLVGFSLVGCGGDENVDTTVDIDLTNLSSTMVYSEVYNMMYEPENYIGKTVKMEGTTSIFHDETTGVTYYACVIADATACCQQGLEFVLADSYDQSDYPELDQYIVVKGVFETYEENGITYCHLVNAEMSK